MIKLLPQWKEYFSDCKNFSDFFSIEGEIAKKFQNRRVVRFVRDDKVFYIKCHRGIGWKEIFISLSHLRKPVLGALDEWKALHKLKALGVDSMQPVAYGEQGSNPATRCSFLITEDLGKNQSLEMLSKNWQQQAPSLKLKRKLIEKVAAIAKCLHENGVNHRDFYICHFLLDMNKGGISLDPDDLKINLIDLHRTQIRKNTPRRWIVKDIGSLYFSVMDIGLSNRDFLRFIRHYKQFSLKRTFNQDRKFWQEVQQRAEKLYRQPIR